MEAQGRACRGDMEEAGVPVGDQEQDLTSLSSGSLGVCVCGLGYWSSLWSPNSFTENKRVQQSSGDGGGELGGGQRAEWPPGPSPAKQRNPAPLPFIA